MSKPWYRQPRWWLVIAYMFVIAVFAIIVQQWWMPLFAVMSFVVGREMAK